MKTDDLPNDDRYNFRLNSVQKARFEKYAKDRHTDGGKLLRKFINNLLRREDARIAEQGRKKFI